jgi:3'-phosphoadenosine 5'-phosphosulfate sulfotransferase (PAPS reductase)/FAD synthetase
MPVMPAPIDLTTYDVVLVNTSAGKDSQAMMDLVVELATAQGVLERVVAVHCDLGRVEWEGTRELAEAHAAHYGLRLEVVSRPQGDLLEQVEARGMWPSSAARYCTSDHKRGQVAKVLTKLTAEVQATRPGQVRILNVMGLRAEESPARARKVELAHDERASNGKRHVDNWLPILGWLEGDVWARIAAAGTTPHPAYAAGMPRLSCCFCVLASRSALVRSAQLNPELAATYADVELRIGHRFKADLSMADIIAEAAATEAPVVAAGWAA